MPYVQLGEVETWYETWSPDADAGGAEAEPLVLLHGGMSDGSAWGANAPAFAERYRVFAPDRRGHGKTPDLDAPFGYDAMAGETIAFMEEVVRSPAHVVGWSDGGNVGLLVALRRPDLVRRLVLVGANFHHDGLMPELDLSDGPDAPEAQMLKMMYEVVAVDPGHWLTFFEKTARLWAEEPTLAVEDLKGVESPTLVLVGDDDGIYWEHTLALYQGIADSQLAVMPGTSHICALEKPALFNELVLAFLGETGPPTTLAPIRRAHPHPE